MPLSEDTMKKIADALYNAEITRIPIDPITQMFPNITIDDAYKIQLINVERKVKLGARIVGKKIGLTSKAMQRLFGVNEPDYGHLFDSMYVDNGETIYLSQLIQPKVEAELAFILKEDLRGPGVTVVDVLRATDIVVPVFEIIDSRIKNWQIKIQDTIADNASAAKFVVGDGAKDPYSIDLKHLGLVFEVNGEIVSTATAASVLGNPARAVAWLANKLAYYGTYLKANEIILSGSFIAAVDAKPKSIYVASFGGLGSVEVRFE